MSYHDTTYNGWTIREHSSDTPGPRFQIVYAAGQPGSFFSTRQEAELAIDYQKANS